MQIIDQSNWSRAAHYQFFCRMDYPQYYIGAEVDITRFLAHIKREGLSFSLAFTYAAATVLNKTEAFRYRIRGETVVLHDTVHPSFTYMDPGDEFFRIITADLAGDMAAFCQKAAAKARSQTELIEDGDRDDVIYMTGIPWISFTGMSHTISLRSGDAVPRLSWGKYFRRDGKVLLPFHAQAHHGFVDGHHMGLLFNGLQAFLDQF